MTLDEIKVGDTASFTKTITQTDVYNFAGVCGDFNPAHVNAVAAAQGMFGRQIAHGMLVASLISTVLGTKLPGEGSIYMGQELKFLRPVYFDDTITAAVTVREIIPEKKKVILDTVCTNQDGTVVISGCATMRPRLQ